MDAAWPMYLLKRHGKGLFNGRIGGIVDRAKVQIITHLGENNVLLWQHAHGELNLHTHVT